MASSRWKRFAFFEKNALSLPSEVLEDLIPIGESNGTTGSRSSSRRSVNSLSDASSSSEASSNDKVSLVVTTAALPLDSKPTIAARDSNDTANNNNNNDYTIALNDMWSSVTACNPMESFPTSSGYAAASSTTTNRNNIHLPSQAQVFEDDSNVVSSGTAVDGLVLAFVTSCDTDRVHCFDISVRCNNKNNESSNGNNNALSDSATAPSSNNKPRKKGGGDLEDLDGWRGYLAPVQQYKRVAATSRDAAARSAEERIIADHMGGGTGGNSEQPKEGIVGIATCRASSGHRPIHMACITTTNIVVCVDPHLFLSWYVVREFIDIFCSDSDSCSCSCCCCWLATSTTNAHLFPFMFLLLTLVAAPCLHPKITKLHRFPLDPSGMKLVMESWPRST